MSEKDRITVKEFEEMFMEILKTSQETEGKTLQTIRDDAGKRSYKENSGVF